jgi:hypothetical protein
LKKWQITAVAAVVVIAVGVGCLFGGRAWGTADSDNNGQDRGAGQNWAGGDRPSGMPTDGSGPFAGPGGRNGGNMVSGSIIAVDNTGITVKTSDGSTKIILVSGSASISLVAAGSIADLKTGENVVVTGTTNDDGTVTATNIRLGESLTLGGTPPDVGTSASGNAPTAWSGTATTQTTAK